MIHQNKKIYKIIKISINNIANYVMRITVKQYFVILISLTILATVLHWLSTTLYELGEDSSHVPNLLWWIYIEKTTNQVNELIICGIYKCRISTDRNILNHSDTKGIIFLGSNIQIHDFPLPRLNHHIWALFHEESPKVRPYIQEETILKHFNYTATFSRYSNFPLTTQHVKSYDELRSTRYVVPVREKNKLRNFLAPIAFLQSNCEAMSGRDEYIEELMKFIQIDSYGECLNNKKLPKLLARKDYLEHLDSDELYDFLSPYKFLISYENGVCNDYITEKFWRAITIGSIPIYYGAPTINDWLPNKKSAILISDFDSPEDLANFIKKLDKDDKEYNKYLDHKYSQFEPITNSFLKDTLLNRLFEQETLYEDFECYLCNKIHNIKSTQYIHATREHYDCPRELTYPKMNKTFDSDNWDVVEQEGICQAAVLNRFLLKNRTYSENEINFEIENDIMTGKCILSF